MQLIETNNICGLYRALYTLNPASIYVVESRQSLGNFARDLIELLADLTKGPHYDKISDSTWLKHLYNYLEIYQNDPIFEDKYTAVFELTAALMDLSMIDDSDEVHGQTQVIIHLRQLDAVMCDSYQFKTLNAPDTASTKSVDLFTLHDTTSPSTSQVIQRLRQTYRPELNPFKHWVDLDITHMYPTMSSSLTQTCNTIAEGRLLGADTHRLTVTNGSPLLRYPSVKDVIGFGGRQFGRTSMLSLMSY